MKPYLKTTLLTLIVAALLYLAGSTAFFVFAARRMYALKSQVPFFADLVKTQQWDRLAFELQPVQDTLSKAELSTRFAHWLAFIPYARQPFLAYSDGVHAGLILVRSADTALQKSMAQSVDGHVDANLFLAEALRSYPELVEAIQSLQSSLVRLQAVSPDLLPTENQEDFAKLLAGASQLQVLVNWATPYLEDVPTLLGAKQPFHILLLLQNPDELRPTGGFIGTYGRLSFDKGQVATFFTDDIYRLPEVGTTVPPQPLQTYLGVKTWSLRDANWSPDFPTSARQIIDLYGKASGEKDMNMVVAVTPRLVEEFLVMTGPITVDNITFTKDNLVDALQYRVEQEFWHIGLTDADRKKIINDLAQALKARFFSMNGEQAQAFIHILEQSLKDRDIQLFATDASLQDHLKAAGWAGETRFSSNDYLAVVDANLGALKTDRLVDRSYHYTVTAQKDGRWLAEVRLTYKNNARTFDYRTTRYRTYTRLYVPLGSTFVDAQGFMSNDKQPATAKPDLYTENNKAVIAGFISIEPGQTRTVTIHYTLAPWLMTQINSRQQYAILWQKQAGTAAHIGFTLESANPLYSFAPSTVSYKLENPRRVTATQTLSSDQTYTVGLSR